MKCLTLALLAIASRNVAAVDNFDRDLASGFPGGPAGAVTAVTQLMRDWAARLDADGKAELSSYDKYACWCEDTLARKAADIASAKEQIDSLQKLIEKLAGEIASHDAEIAHLKKLIADNKQEQADATATRENENSEFEGEKTEGEQCIGALEAAITALSGAGEGKGAGFVQTQTMQEAQLLSVVGGVKTVLRKATPNEKVSAEDLELVRDFFDQPSRMFLRPRREGASLLAVGSDHNPFGDYAPQSTRITGVLKSLYDTFAMDLEKGNVEEAEAQKSFEELMATKQAELETLEKTLEQQEASSAAKKKEKAESKALRADVKDQLKADEEFFATSKAACKAKAVSWGERVRMRTEELQGIEKAIEILSDPEAQATFTESSAQLIQLSSKVVRPTPLAAIQTLAKRSGSVSVARIAAEMQSTGYFDKVMGEIEEMIALLRREEKMDIEHKDRCENAKNGNANSVEDLTANIQKADEEIARMEHEQGKANTEISALDIEIAKTESDMELALGMRNTERKAFEKSVKDDTAAIAVLEKALEALQAFYKRNKLAMLVQQGQPREYTVSEDAAPETSWDSKGYTGAKSENTGVTAIISMIIEDVKKEIAESRKDDADAEADYEKDKAGMEKTHLAQTQTKAALEKKVQELDMKIQETNDHKDARQADLDVQNDLKGTLANDCNWIDAGFFKSRADNRKKEMDGLVEAKNYLAGVSDGTGLGP